MTRRTRPKPTVRKDVFETPSGLGGIFSVILIEDRGDTALVEVQYPCAGWHGYRFSCAKADLSPTTKSVVIEGGAA